MKFHEPQISLIFLFLTKADSNDFKFISSFDLDGIAEANAVKLVKSAESGRNLEVLVSVEVRETILVFDFSLIPLQFNVLCSLIHT